MHPSHLLIGEACLIVRAQALPNGYNQRPGITLLAAAGSAPLTLEIEGQTATADGWLLAPELRRRFTRPQPHISITLEPGHPTYARLLAWARQHPHHHRPLHSDAGIAALTRLADEQALVCWINRLLDRHQQPAALPNPRLAHLLSLLRAADTDATAERLWQAFRQHYPGTQAHHSHWLQHSIGIPLRKLVLWRKLRRALEMLSDNRPATEVAHAAGFADSAHLSRICLRTFGLKPSQASNHKILQVQRLPAD